MNAFPNHLLAIDVGRYVINRTLGGLSVCTIFSSSTADTLAKTPPTSHDIGEREPAARMNIASSHHSQYADDKRREARPSFQRGQNKTNLNRRKMSVRAF